MLLILEGQNRKLTGKNLFMKVQLKDLLKGINDDLMVLINDWGCICNSYKKHFHIVIPHNNLIEGLKHAMGINYLFNLKLGTYKSVWCSAVTS